VLGVQGSIPRGWGAKWAKPTPNCRPIDQ